MGAGSCVFVLVLVAFWNYAEFNNENLAAFKSSPMYQRVVKAVYEPRKAMLDLER